MNIPYLLFGKSIKRKLAEGQLRPKGFEGMKPCWIGTDAMQYYAWAEVGDMPPVRQKEIEALLKWMDAGCTEKTIAEITTAAEDMMMNKVLRAKNDQERAKFIAGAVKLMEELRIRSKEVIPEELYYAMVAVCVAREDEDPTKFDRTNYRRTQNMLSQAGKDGQVFFLETPTFKKLLGESLTTASALPELQSSWRVQSARTKAVLDISSGMSSNSTTKTSSASSSGSQAQPTIHK